MSEHLMPVPPKTKTKVSEFLISPPVDPAFECEEVLKRLEVHMAEQFPDLRFHVRANFPMRHPDGFTIVPILGYPAANKPHGGFSMRPPPSDELMQDIQAALREFDPAVIPPVLH